MSGKQERHGPDGPLNDLTGKAIVNDSPNERDEPDTDEILGTADGPGTDDDAGTGGGPGTADGLGMSDELALRRMLRGAVEELEPSRDALEHLRKAVPARRARRRQAVVGMAAAALFVGTAVPAFVHVANSDSAADGRPSIAGHGRDTHGGTGWEKGVDGGKGKRVEEKPSEKELSREEKKKQKKEKDARKGSSDAGESRSTGSGGGGGGAEAPGSVPASTPTCGASQLSVVSAGTGTPDAEGKVYGTFRVVNVSEMQCTVAGRGSVYAQPMGAADPSRINVVDHTSGDAAAGLPDPSLETTGLLLEPDMAYEVKFAWVPTDSCPTTNPSPDPVPTDPGPDPGPTGGTEDGSTGGIGGTGKESETEQSGMEPQLGTEDGGTADGSVSVSHTPEAGASSAAATVPNACAGTIYRTGVLAAQ
ncbi:hypothetical protein [Streptomyces sp. Wb2n-11]|uniref:hypothetical protein n=1 Tax=Streptomyces sp. Wb2n-11 TaxID=1030533 RepID=UPI000A7D7743|nr:hypothetical protein [Streptomyces sp. Wb2n-11]